MITAQKLERVERDSPEGATRYDTVALLTGGAVRDQILGKEVRDYDIYMEATCSEEARAIIVQTACNLNVPFVELGNAEYGSYAAKLLVPGSEVEIITSPLWIDEFIQCYPATISMCYAGENLNSVTSDDFEEAVLLKTITFYEGFPVEYMEKIKAKFPEYEAVIKPSRMDGICGDTIPIQGTIMPHEADIGNYIPRTPMSHVLPGLEEEEVDGFPA